MNGISELCYQGGLFCGFIGLKSLGKSINQFDKLAMKLVEQNGSLIYLYKGNEEKPDLEALSKLLQMDLFEKVKNRQLIFVNIEELFIEKDTIDLESAIKLYEKEIDVLREKGIEKVLVYGTRNNYNIKNSTKKGLYKYHQNLKALCKEKNIMVIIKYIVDDLYEKEFVELISLHDVFVLDGDKTGKKYTYLELISTSLLYLSKKQQKDEEFRQEMKRIEYLKNLGELIEGFTHDLNNLLTTVIGFSQIVLFKDREKQFTDYLNVIYNTAIDAKTIMDKVQGFIKGSNIGEKKLHRINDLVKSSINMIKYKIKFNSKKIGKEIILKEDLKSERCIYGDEFELRQVFLNILLNALDAMEGGGTLKVKTYDENEKVYVQIIDTGIGMSEEVKMRIFDPFFTTKGKEGTGLGLNTAKKILENHSADVVADSEIGLGTTFTIIFPENIKEIRYAEEEINSEIIHGANVLVVDDKYLVAKTIAELIGLVNMSAEVETNSESVLTRLDENVYDIVICDYSMPNKNGLEISQLVKEKYPEKPFILLTGYSDKVNEKPNTIDYVLEKPCSVEELVDVLGKALNVVDDNRNKSYNIN